MNWTEEALRQQSDGELLALYRGEEEAFTGELLRYLQEADASVRELLAVQPFFRLLQMQQLNEEEKLRLYEALVSEDALFYEETKDAVITRATVAFLVSQLVPQLTSLEDFSGIVRYLRFEQDGRGHISEEIGWSDAIGGAIDLTTVAIQHPNFPQALYVQLLQAIRGLLWQVHAFTNNEEERFAKLAVLMLQKGLPEDAFIEWVEQLVDKLEYYAYDYGHDLTWFEARTNTMALLRALYFACKFSKQDKKIEAILSLFIQKYML